MCALINERIHILNTYNKCGTFYFDGRRLAIDEGGRKKERQKT